MSKGARLRSQRERLQGHVRQGKTGQTWYRIDNLVQSPGSACIYLYGEVGMWGVTAEDFVRDLQNVNASQLDLHINSMGGDVFEGIAILNALRAHRATVTTYVDGLAASIASVIAMAGEKVVMGRNTTMMIHEAHAIAIGEADDMRSMADLLDKTNDNIASIYAEKSGGDAGQWREAMRVETWYSAEEAVAAGLADEVEAAPEREPTDDAMAASYDLSVFKYAGRDQAPAPAIPAPANSADPAPDPEPDEDTDPENKAAEPGEDEPVEEPAVEPAAKAEPGTEPDEDDAPGEPDEDEDEDTDEIPANGTDAAVTDQWAALQHGLLAHAAPSTVDELLAALEKEGTPA
ncbi:head maturation protease, ClpP-related [Amycolatopsis sp. NPDC058340]|uniref:head maturation protease, ClpP-related n=1 Tax=Amycolatopsis sp. NPDC058340 TaxID=3346453 RepID=UPI0036695636